MDPNPKAEMIEVDLAHEVKLLRRLLSEINVKMGGLEAVVDSLSKKRAMVSRGPLGGIATGSWTDPEEETDNERDNRIYRTTRPLTRRPADASET